VLIHVCVLIAIDSCATQYHTAQNRTLLMFFSLILQTIVMLRYCLLEARAIVYVWFLEDDHAIARKFWIWVRVSLVHWCWWLDFTNGMWFAASTTPRMSSNFVKELWVTSYQLTLFTCVRGYCRIYFRELSVRSQSLAFWLGSSEAECHDEHSLADGASALQPQSSGVCFSASEPSSFNIQ